MTDAWPNRHRLYGGRNTHASRPTPGTTYGITRGMTACGYPVSGNDHPEPDGTPVTCRNCIRGMNR